MGYQGDRKARRRTKYRNLVPGLALLTALALLMVGVTAVRLGLIAVDVRLGPRLNGAAPTTTVAAPKPPPAPRRARVSEAPAPVAAGAPEPLAAPAEAPIPAKRAATIAMAEAAPPDDPPATPARSVAPAPPSKALASAVGKAKRVADCAAMLATAVNVDPTAGEISGTTGLPDQVSYFKSRGRSASCRPLAGIVTSPR